MDEVEQRLVSFTRAFSFGDIEPQVLHGVKQRFIDTIGCALGAFQEGSSVIARRIALSHGYSAAAGVIGTGSKSSVELSAFANTAMIRCLDLNDDYFGKDGPHPSDLMGAVVAACDSIHADGRSFLTAITVAYETLCTLVDAVGLRERGWDYVSFTALAAALGVGKIFQFADATLRDSLSLAAVANCALGQTRLGELSMWKGLASANACRNAVFACMLAEEGVSGPHRVFEGKNGILAQITGPLDLSTLGRAPLRAGVVYLKCWPLFYSAQAAVQAALALRKEVSLSQIKSVTVESYSRLLGRGSTDPEKWVPKSRETADHSVPFCVAAALIDGNITPKTFESKRFLDSDVIDLMSKVRLREDPEFTKQYPGVWNCRMTAETLAGTRHQVQVAYPKGHPKNPFSDAEIEDKFVTLAEPLIGRAKCGAFLQWAWRLEEASDLGKMFQFLAP